MTPTPADLLIVLILLAATLSVWALARKEL